MASDRDEMNESYGSTTGHSDDPGPRQQDERQSKRRRIDDPQLRRDHSHNQRGRNYNNNNNSGNRDPRMNSRHGHYNSRQSGQNRDYDGGRGGSREVQQGDGGGSGADSAFQRGRSPQRNTQSQGGGRQSASGFSRDSSRNSGGRPDNGSRRNVPGPVRGYGGNRGRGQNRGGSNQNNRQESGDGTEYASMAVDNTRVQQGSLYYQGITMQNSTMDVRMAQVAKTGLGYTKAEVMRRMPQRYQAMGEGGVKPMIPFRENDTPVALLSAYTENVLSLAAGENERDARTVAVRPEPSKAAEYFLAARLDPKRVFGEGGVKVPGKDAFKDRMGVCDVHIMAQSYVERLNSPTPLVQWIKRKFDDDTIWDKFHKDIIGSSPVSPGTYPAEHGYVIPSLCTDLFKISSNPPMPIAITADSAYEYMNVVRTHDEGGWLVNFDTRGNGPSNQLKNEVAMQQRQRQAVCFELATTFRMPRLPTTDQACLMTFFETMSRNPGSGINELMSRGTTRVFMVVWGMMEHVMGALGRRGLLATTELVTTNADMAADPLVSYEAVKAFYENEPLTEEQLDEKINVGPMTEIGVPGTNVKLYHLKVGNKWTTRQEKVMYGKSPATMMTKDKPVMMAFEPFTGGLPSAAYGAETLKWDQLVNKKLELIVSTVMQRVGSHFDRNIEFPFDANHLVVFASFVSTMQAMVGGVLDDLLRTGTAKYVPALLFDPNIGGEYGDMRTAVDFAISNCKFSVIQWVFGKTVTTVSFRALLQWVILMMQVRGGLQVEYTKLRLWYTLKAMVDKTEAERLDIVYSTVLFLDERDMPVSYNRWLMDVYDRSGVVHTSLPSRDYVPVDEMRELVKKSKFAALAQKPLTVPVKMLHTPQVALLNRLSDWQLVSINDDTLLHKVLPVQNAYGWAVLRVIKMKAEVTEGVKMTFLAFDTKMGESQDGLESAIRKTAKMFAVETQLTVAKVNETLEKYGNKKKLLSYVKGEKVCLPLLKQDSMISTGEPEPLLLTRWARSSLFMEGTQKGSFSLMSEEQVIVEFILSLCPKVVNFNDEQSNYKGPMSVLGAFCALLFPGTVEYLCVVAGANIMLYCCACMKQLLLRKGVAMEHMDPRFGLVAVNSKLGDNEDNLSLYHGTVVEPNSTEAGWMYMRLPFYHPIRAAVMTEEGSSGMVGMLWLLGVMGYNITGVQKCEEFVRVFTNTAHRIRQSAMEVTGKTDKDVLYEDVVIAMCDLHKQLRIVGIHTQYQKMFGLLMNGKMSWDTPDKMLMGMEMILGGDVQYTNDRKWGVVQTGADNKLRRPKRDDDREIDAPGDDRRGEVALFQRTNELTNSYKSDLPPEVKRGFDTLMSTLWVKPIPNAITMNALTTSLAMLSLRGKVINEYIEAVVVVVNTAHKLSESTCAAYDAKTKKNMPKKRRHEMFSGTGAASLWEDYRFARLVAATAPVLEFAACLSPKQSVNHIMMKLLMANVGTMVCEGFDDELRVALSHTNMWRSRFRLEEIEDNSISDWADWEEYSMIPEIVMYLSGDTDERKKEVKDLCTAKLKPPKDNIEVDDDDDDMSGAEDSSDENKEIRKRGAESLARYKAEYEPTVTVPNPAVEAMDDTGSAMRTLDPVMPLVTPFQAELNALNLQMVNVPRTPVNIGATGSDQYLEDSEANTAAFGGFAKEASASTGMTEEEMARALNRLNASEALVEQREEAEANARQQVQGPATTSKPRNQGKLKVNKAASKTASKTANKN